MLERAVSVQVQREWTVVCAGNVAGHGTEGLDLAAKTLRRSGIDQEQRVAMQACAHARSVHRRCYATNTEIRRARFRHVGVYRAALFHPLGKAAVENGDGL